MCGISGRIGINVLPQLLEDLKKLEYRGYDSAGLGYFKKSNITLKKVKGSVHKLEGKTKFETNIGIAHTRWATHGRPTKDNAHPHISYGGNWAVVHNGIIENVNQLKLQLGGVQFKSQTDTEVIAHLLEKHGSGLQSLQQVSNLLHGSFAVVALNTKYPDTLFVMKNKSPMYVYNETGEVVVTSDTLTLKKQEYYELYDGEIGVLTKNNVRFYNQNGEVLKQKINFTSMDFVLPSTNYKHHMLKEIFDTPLALKYLIDYYSKTSINIDIKKYSKIKLFGCGTAYHTALMGAGYLQKLTRKECNANVASDYLDTAPIVDKKSLNIFISQSGETADTMECMNLVKRNKGKCVLITNKPNSTMAKLADVVLPMCAGTEVAVASTKAYTCGVAVLYLMASYFKYGTPSKALAKLKHLQKNIAYYLQRFEPIDVRKIKKLKTCFFIGRGMDYITALEGSLKLKEISYINCIAFPAGELKHGTLALIDNNSMVFAISTSKTLHPRLVSAISEIEARGGKVQLLSTVKDTQQIFNSVDEMLDGLQIMVYLQLLSYYTAVAKGYNPDKPRNLAKSVTVG